MKKLLNGLLAFAIVCGAMGVNVSAAHKITQLDVEKTVELDGGTLAPKEEFTFTMTPVDVEEGTVMDHLEVKPGLDLGDNSTIKIVYNENDEVLTKKTMFDLSKLTFEDKAAIYRYEIKEVAGSTASVHYDSDKFIVDIYVTNEGNIEYVIPKDSAASQKKPVAFTNIYETETLEISKQVKGIFSNKDEEFKFRLTLNAADTLSDGTKLTAKKAKNNGVVEDISMTVGEENVFTLKDGEKLTVDNLPEGLTYTVTEDEAAGYTSEMTDSDNGKMSDDGAKVEFVNTKIDVPETGVTLTTLPYILSLVVAGSGIFALNVMKRKKSEA